MSTSKVDLPLVAGRLNAYPPGKGKEIYEAVHASSIASNLL